MHSEQQRTLSRILVTGGCGFIGTNFIRQLFARDDFTGTVVNLDVMTYAADPRNLEDIADRYGEERYICIPGDICDRDVVESVFRDYNIDTVVNFAAESHVDRSILGPAEFIRTNIQGTFTLLEVARSHWEDSADCLFHHVSTDEVYGSLGPAGAFTESTAYDPRSPYSASKASSDHLVSAWHHTYGLPATISNCSNNYGPYQFPEKLIPLMITNMLDGKPLPVYGDGKNIRDWLYVTDHCDGIITVMCNGATGETYNIGGETEKQNIELLHMLCEAVAEQTGTPVSRYTDSIAFVTDRPGHDRRYAIDCTKMKRDLGWKQEHNFEDGLRDTVRWYLDNTAWLESIRDNSYRNWIEKNYEQR